MIPESLTIVRGAVSTKDLVPVLKHLALNNGEVHGFNGHVHICTYDENLVGLPPFTVPADRALKALDACAQEPAELEVADNIMSVRAGRFRARVQCGNIEDFPLHQPSRSGELPCEELLDVFQALHDFISDDASRPWSQGILLSEGVAYATNNIVLAAVDLPESLLHLPMMTVPLVSINEVLRIGLTTTSLVYDESTLTFFLADGRTWVRSSLIKEGWPDAASLIASVHADANMEAFPPEFRESVEKLHALVRSDLKPVMLFREGRVDVATSLAEEALASVDGFALPDGAYGSHALALVVARSTHADWTRWPRVPFAFQHDDGMQGLRGVLVGVRT